ncbi:hypothetical protein Aduo_007497 [Ancylostoma duodenale]
MTIISHTYDFEVKAKKASQATSDTKDTKENKKKKKADNTKTSTTTTTGTKTSTSKPKSSAKKRRLFLIGGALLFIGVLVAIALITVFMKTSPPKEKKKQTVRPTSSTSRTTTTEKPPCQCICNRSDVMEPHPPLIVVSLDGYAKKFLSRKSPSVFDKMAKCGVKAEAVYSTFPSSTFVNHYSIATGLHGGHHGIVHNVIFDPSMDPEPQYLGTNLRDGYYQKETIWSYYKRHHKKKVAAFSWIGSQHNSTYYQQPDYMIKYDSRHKPNQTFQQVVDWLRMDPADRPGLIMAYIAEPDMTGHRTLSTELDQMLTDLDNSIKDFMNTLEKDGILCCVNIVFVSDHGMTEIKDFFALDHYISLEGLTLLTGSPAHIFTGNSTLSVKEIKEALTCRGADFVRVFTNSTMPLRLHFSNSHRIGDLVIIPRIDVIVVRDNDEGKMRTLCCSHGFDYIEPDMHTIMFAQGPSLKQNVVLPPFQLVEYMNLWRKLLKLPQMETDGEPAFMDLALDTQDSYLTRQTIPSIQKCANPSSLAAAKLDKICGKCSAEDKAAFQSWIKCDVGGVSTAIVPQSNSSQLCFLAGCKDMAIIKNSKEEAYTVTLLEVYSNNDNEKLLTPNCNYNLLKPKAKCDRPDLSTEDSEVQFRSLSAVRGRVLANEHSLITPWKARFLKEILKPLNDYTAKIVTKLGKVVSITGTAYDDDYDGKHSTTPSKSPYPTHLYRILLTCENEWSEEGAYCTNATDTKVLSFVFPHMNGNTNCLNRKDLLLQYTATVRQIETLTGIYFDFTKIPEMEQLLLKMHISTQIW